MKLKELLESVQGIIKNNGCSPAEEEELEITALVSDSRVEIKKGNAFVCITGTKTDGHDFAKAAEAQGASVIFTEHEVELEGKAKLVIVEDTRKALALLACAWFGYPGRQMKLIGITGTKGKSTTCYMIRDILKAAGRKVGIIGTIGICIGEKVYDTNNTTPDPYLIQMYLREMVDSGCDTLVMEVSSQGLKQHRVYGLEFDYGVFTNLGHDHIGGVEHADFDEYLYCKSLLFKQCKTAVVNAEDEHIEALLKDATCVVEGFGGEKLQANLNNDVANNGKYVTDSDAVKKSAGETNNNEKILQIGAIGYSKLLTSKNITLYIENGEAGIRFDYEAEGFKGSAKLPIPGRFNVMNALCAISVCRHFTEDKNVIANALENTFVLGRLEPVRVSDKFSVLIDYAHNAMALESVLKTLREYQPKRLVNLFGCGGDRSKDRRFEMGEVSSRMADLTVVTSDNPRTEKPEDIIADILVGVKRADGKYIMIADRREAIRYVLENAEEGDVILLAGKGNETYQEINGVKHHMDEREIVREIMADLSR